MEMKWVSSSTIFGIMLFAGLIINPLHAEQEKPTWASQELKSFVQLAAQQGLSVDQIVEQALSQGYTKEQVISAYSALMAEEFDETPSTQNTLMWYALGAVVTTIIGIGVWYIYESLKPPTERLTMTPSTGLRPNQPPAGRNLSAQEQARVDEIIAQGIAAGRRSHEISEEVRRTFPDTRFYMVRSFSNGGHIRATTRSWNEAGPRVNVW